MKVAGISRYRGGVKFMDNGLSPPTVPKTLIFDLLADGCVRIEVSSMELMFT
jgi:hypothetical protein